MAESELTTLQTILNNILDEMGVVHEDEYSIWAGGHQYRLDAYLPDYHAYIEADGPGIHHSRNKDATRDINLMREGLVGMHAGMSWLTGSPKETIVLVIRVFLENAEQTVAQRRGRVKDAFAAFTEG